MKQLDTQITESDFIELIQENSGVINKVIRLYVDDIELRKDAYQEILLQAWKSIKNFKGDSKFSTWLYKVSLNTVFTLKRRNNIQTVELNPIEHDLSNGNKKEDYEILYYLIKRLNKADRIIITLHLDGYKNPEIAEILGLKLNHLNVKLYRIKHAIIDQSQNLKLHGHL